MQAQISAVEATQKKAQLQLNEQQVRAANLEKSLEDKDCKLSTAEIQLTSIQTELSQLKVRHFCTGPCSTHDKTDGSLFKPPPMSLCLTTVEPAGHKVLHRLLEVLHCP